VHNHIRANHTIYSLTPEMKVRFCLFPAALDPLLPRATQPKRERT
jgi:hypothetical protein